MIGPESTGKTSLCLQLAEYFNTVCIPEFAREYIASLNRPYTKSDVLYCAEMQLKSEDVLSVHAKKYLFVDTELINIKIWLLDKYGDCPAWIENKIEEKKYDLYLLTSPDVPFVVDPVRENPDRRDYFFDIYLHELESHGLRYEIITGFGQKRFDSSLKVILNLDIEPSKI